MVEREPRHPRVEGSSLAAAARTVIEKNGENIEFIFIPVILITYNHLPMVVSAMEMGPILYNFFYGRNLRIFVKS